MGTIKDLLMQGGQLPPIAPGGTTYFPQDNTQTLGAMMKGGPKTWQKVLGVLGDAITSYSGGRGMFIPAELDRRQREQDMQQAWNLAERQGQMATDRWKAEQQYKLNNPTPGSFQWYQGATPEERAVYDMYNPKNIVGPDGIPRMIPRGGGELPPGYDPSEWELIDGEDGNGGPALTPGMFP